jgi:hypothetical protein
MNRDAHLIFEAYLNEMSTRLVQGKSAEAGNTQVTFPEKAAKYSLTPEQTKNAIERIVAKLEDHGGFYDKSDKEFQKEFMAPEIKEASGKNATLSTYAARVIHSALKKAGVVSSDAGEGTTLRDSSDEAQDDAADEVPDIAAENPPTEAEKTHEDDNIPDSGEEETVYHKSADFNSDDDHLMKAWKKLPSDKDLDWEQVCKLIGASTGIDLIDAGGLNEEVKRKEAGEGDYSEGDTGEVTSGINNDELDEIGDIAGRGTDSFSYKGSPFRYSHE